MCRNIRTLFNFDPPASEQEVHEASLQFVRKLSGFTVPSKANEAVFQRAVAEVAASATVLIRSLTTISTPRDREAEAVKARAGRRRGFGRGRPTEEATRCASCDSVLGCTVLSAEVRQGSMGKPWEMTGHGGVLGHADGTLATRDARSRGAFAGGAAVPGDPTGRGRRADAGGGVVAYERTRCELN